MRDLWLPFRWLSLAATALCHRPIRAGTTSRFSGFWADCRPCWITSGWTVIHPEPGFHFKERIGDFALAEAL
jgi:hypothetical protein